VQELTKKIVKSPLRYPGGKSRALKEITSLIPKDYKEFREPFVGGGSVFLNSKQVINHDAKYVINDLNEDLVCFWKTVRDRNDELVNRIQEIKDKVVDGRKLYKYLVDNHENLTDFEKAVRFFVLNRITFSGTVDSGGYSEQAFEKRFTDSSIYRISLLKETLKNVEISNVDYKELLNNEGEDVFIFLDPPYSNAVKSKLYGKNGDLHIGFDYEKFAEDMKECNHRWLITLNNSPDIVELFSFANIYEWELQYGMNNYKQKNALKGKELFISNYPIK
jgi:DNA adenine methylase